MVIIMVIRTVCLFIWLLLHLDTYLHNLLTCKGRKYFHKYRCIFTFIVPTLQSQHLRHYCIQHLLWDVVLVGFPVREEVSASIWDCSIMRNFGSYWFIEGIIVHKANGWGTQHTDHKLPLYCLDFLFDLCL